MKTPHSFDKFVSSVFNFSDINISFGLVFVIVILFLLVFSSDVVGQADISNFRFVLTVYLLMQLAVFGLSKTKDPLFDVSFKRGALIYLIVFFISTTFFSFLGKVYHSQSLVFNFSLPLYTLLYAIVVSFSEDIVFAVFLPSRVGRIASAFLFAVFHTFVYFNGVSFMVFLLRLMFAMSMNLVFQFLCWRFGPTGSAGLHASYNLWVLGFL